ncbi:F0F1 ATP synthase subunit delta [Aestuariibacter halophilus]|uniref:ATP synthase subunit b n=1 Tax=Fluctibacter halophilus TaxID=226011 RepID=A0ABS8G8F4_9ALTE|nr:F0F1 ATP synthase subunit delta [Aestuariibacter halophilus]MCC2616862.1 F0F1 ATP synthase subunit delta [Aestuariibacter halophilus]
MELNGTTFILELINFIVLMWLLKRFLYRPVIDAIERRRKRIEDSLEEARQHHEEADAIKLDYETRLAELEQAFKSREAGITKQITALREQKMAQLEQDLAEERSRRLVLLSDEQNEAWHALEKQAANLSCQFVARLLREFAGPELEKQMVQRLINDLSALPEARKKALRDRAGNARAMVTTAYTLPSPLQQALATALAKTANDDALQCSFEVNPALLSGAEIALDAFRIQATLNSELAFFNELLHES